MCAYITLAENLNQAKNSKNVPANIIMYCYYSLLLNIDAVMPAEYISEVQFNGISLQTVTYGNNVKHDGFNVTELP